ncbi:MAG: hypothetical protein AB2705_02655, partial [Candidatus Thiodiazotropha sp.]
ENLASLVVAISISWRDCSTYSRHIMKIFGVIITLNHATLVQKAIYGCRPHIPCLRRFAMHGIAAFYVTARGIHHEKYH